MTTNLNIDIFKFRYWSTTEQMYLQQNKHIYWLQIKNQQKFYAHILWDIVVLKS